MSRVPSGSTVPFTPKPNKKARSSRLTLSDREFNNVGHYSLFTPHVELMDRLLEHLLL